MGKTYLRMPRLHRLEYLDTLLRSFGSDGEFDEGRAKLAVQREIQEFEQRKARALRRQRPRISEGTRTFAECLEMAMQLDLIGANVRPKRKMALVLDPDPAVRRRTLLESIWQVYPRFSQVVLAVRDAGSLKLPFYNWDEYRRSGGDLFGLNMDRKSFEIVRDFGTQLGLLNWYPPEDGWQIVYPAACVATQMEVFWASAERDHSDSMGHQCKRIIALEIDRSPVAQNRCSDATASEIAFHDGLVLYTTDGCVFVKDHDVIPEHFERSVWREYLALADMISMAPVLYPTLRNQVCASLRISDQTFDRHLVSLIKQPQRLNVHPSDGTLSYAANLAHIGKFLPPQTSEGNFIVYLKMERRN